MQRINIAPYPSPRPRFTKHGRTYMPKAYTDWKYGFLKLWRLHGGRKFEKHVPIKVNLAFYIAPPKAIESVKKHQTCLEKETIPVPKKPDADNFIKSVLDALNGYAWQDDGQITDITAVKRYSKNPRVEIEIFPV